MVIINATAASCAVHFGVAYIALIYTAIVGGQLPAIQQPNATFADQFGFLLRNGMTADYYANLAMFSAQSNGSSARIFCTPTTNSATSMCLREHLADIQPDVRLRATQICGHIVAVSNWDADGNMGMVNVMVRGDDGSVVTIKIRGDDQDVLARLGPEFWYESGDPMASSAHIIAPLGITFASAIFAILAARA